MNAIDPSASTSKRLASGLILIGRLVPSMTTSPMCCAMALRLFRRQKPREDVGRLFPLARLALDLLPARRRQPIKLRPTAMVGRAPVRLDVAFLLELEQRRIDGAVVQHEPI